MNRYFFFSYDCKGPGKVATGNLFLNCDKFPPNTTLRQMAAEKGGFQISETIITSMFEFKDKEDYDSFCCIDPEVKYHEY